MFQSQPTFRIIWKLGKFRRRKTLYKYTQEEIRAAKKRATHLLSHDILLLHTATGLTALFVKYNDKEYILK